MSMNTRPGPVGPDPSPSDASKAAVNASAAAKDVVGVLAIAATAGLLGVLKRSSAQVGAPSPRPGSQNIPVDKNLLVGRWRGNRDAGIEFGIEFKPDGSYAYIVGEPGTWQLAHIGQYCVRPSRVSGEWTNTILVLAPTAIHSATPGPFEQSTLEARGACKSAIQVRHACSLRASATRASDLERGYGRRMVPLQKSQHTDFNQLFDVRNWLRMVRNQESEDYGASFDAKWTPFCHWAGWTSERERRVDFN